MLLTVERFDYSDAKKKFLNNVVEFILNFKYPVENRIYYFHKDKQADSKNRQYSHIYKRKLRVYAESRYQGEYQHSRRSGRNSCAHLKRHLHIGTIRAETRYYAVCG